MIHFVEQLLNGLQFGVMLFLMAAGLTLIFGIMNVINLAHGALYMVGAYVAAATFAATGSFFLGLAAALAAAALLGVALEIIVFRTLYARDHLDQVLATFGLILFFNEVVRVLWGSTALYMRVPAFLDGRVEILPGSPYPVYRLAIIAVGLLVALLLYLLIARTRIGMLIRAGAANRVMLGALGVNVTVLYTFVFALGAALAVLAGAGDPRRDRHAGRAGIRSRGVSAARKRAVALDRALAGAARTLADRHRAGFEIGAARPARDRPGPRWLT